MKWSWKLGEFAGIGVFVHWTFLILIGWIVLAQARHGADAVGVAVAVAFVLSIFGCVVLHEYGHALTARRYGIRTRSITLLPIGGVAMLERMPDDPRQELWVALAGPAVNVGIAAVLIVVLAVLGQLPTAADLGRVGSHFMRDLLYVNVMLVGFNLLPAFPMDGGRVLRALLAHRLDYARATQIAATVGQGMAILFGFAGLLWNPFLLFIALFVFLGAQAEAQATQTRWALRDVPVRDAMITRFRTLDAAAPLAAAVDELLAGSQQDFPVVSGERLVGILPRNALIRALARQGTTTTIGEAMQADCHVVDEGDMVQSAFDRMRESGCSALPVLRRGELVGLLTLENVGEFMMINSALGTATPRAAVDDIFAAR